MSKEKNLGSEIGNEFLDKALKQFKNYKELVEKALEQVKDDNKLTIQLDEESNSIAIIIKHLAGNMKSRWTDIFTTDGEKPDRHRPQEFDRSFQPTRIELLNLWNAGWELFFTTYKQLKPSDLNKTIYIRKEPHTVLDAILRQLAHYSSHMGQILFIAKHLEWENWKHVTLERNAEVFDHKEIKK